MNEIGGNYVVIATKVDKLPAHEAEASLRRLQEAMDLPPEMPIRFSAVTGEGKRQVWHAIKDGLLDRGLYAIDGSDGTDDAYEEDDDDEEDVHEDSGFP